MKLLHQMGNDTKSKASPVVSYDTETMVNSPELQLPTTAVIQNWLVAQVAARLEMPEAQIDTEKDFSDYGFPSIEAVNLSGELENFLGRRLSPTILWDYPNITALAEYLGEEMSPTTEAAPQPSAMEAVAAQQLLANLDNMSDADVDAMLSSMLSEQEP